MFTFKCKLFKTGECSYSIKCTCPVLPTDQEMNSRRDTRKPTLYHVSNTEVHSSLHVLPTDQEMNIRRDTRKPTLYHVSNTAVHSSLHVLPTNQEMKYCREMRKTTLYHISTTKAHSSHRIHTAWSAFSLFAVPYLP